MPLILAGVALLAAAWASESPWENVQEEDAAAASKTADCLLQTQRQRLGLEVEADEEDMPGPDGHNESFASVKDGSVIVEDVPSNESLEKQDEFLAKQFAFLDKDKSGSLNASELRRGLFDGWKLQQAHHQKSDPHVNVSTSNLSLPMSAVKHYLLINDADMSGGLDLQEYRASLTAHKANNTTSLAQTRSFRKCVSYWTETTTIKGGCIDERQEQECWWNWRFWTASFWSCRWNTVTVLVDCAVQASKWAVAGFGHCYTQVIDEVKKLAAGAHKQFLSLLPDNCQSAGSCKKALLSEPEKVTQVTVKNVGTAFSDLIASDALEPGVGPVSGFVEKLPAIAGDVLSVAERVGQAILSFATGKLQSAHALSNLGDLCTPSGLGYLHMEVTDCEAFDALQKIFDEAWQVWNIQVNFDQTVSKFGNCLSKSGLLTQATPFQEVRVDSYCLPSALQAPIKATVGAFQYFVQQLKKAGSGCCGTGSGAEQAVCQLVADIKGVGRKLKSVLDSHALLQQSSRMGQLLHGNSSAYSADCIGGDFRVFVEVAVDLTLPVPPFGKMVVATMMDVSSGCRHGKTFVDYTLGFSPADRSILGVQRGAETVKVAPQMGAGFEIGTPTADLVSWAAVVKIEGSLPATPLNVKPESGTGLDLIILPELAYPTGFKASFTVAKAVPLALASGQATAKADTPEAEVHAALGAAAAGVAGMDLPAAFGAPARSPAAALELGARAMRRLRETAAGGGEEARKQTLSLSLGAGVQVSFCLSCADRQATFSDDGCSA